MYRLVDSMGVIVLLFNISKRVLECSYSYQIEHKDTLKLIAPFHRFQVTKIAKVIAPEPS